MGAIFYGYAIVSIPWRAPALQYTMSRWSGIALYDADRCFLGVIPGAREGLDDFSDGTRAPADEKMVPVKAVPRGFWDVVVALEHGSIGRWRTLPLLGVDFLSAGQAVIDTAGGARRGASGLPQLVAGALIKSNHGSTDNWLGRKVDEVLNGAALYSRYSLLPSEADSFPHLVANYLPLAQSTVSGKAGVLYGVEVTGRILFGKASEELSLAEQALLAAAVKLPLVLAPANDPKGQRLAARIFRRLQHRAAYGLGRAYGRGTPMAERAIGEVYRMALPMPKICRALRPHLPDDPSARFRVEFSPVHRAQSLAREEIAQVLSELRSAAGDAFRDHVREVRLSLRARENLPFKRSIEHRLALVEQEAANLPIALTGGQGGLLGDILVAASDDRGRVRLYYQSSERSLFDSQSPTGSIAKVIAALALARRGNATDAYCNRRIDGVLQNASGDTGHLSCAESGAWISARRSFQKSLNLPIFSALQTQSETRLQALLRETGFEGFDDTPVPTAVAFGMVYASPADMLRLMSAIRQGITGRPASAKTPRIIASISWRDPGRAQAVEVGQADVSAYLKSARAMRYAATVLAAPLGQGGTAESLRGCRASVTWNLAKTGTVAQSGRVQRKLLLASGKVRGETLSVIGMIGLPQGTGDISPIRTSTLASVLCDGLMRKEISS